MSQVCIRCGKKATGMLGGVEFTVWLKEERIRKTKKRRGCGKGKRGRGEMNTKRRK